MNTKICTLCGRDKPLGEYSKRKNSEPWLKSACKECHRTRAKAYWKRNPLPKEVQRERNLKKSFGIGIAQYNELLSAQGGLCAICGSDTCVTGRNLAVDHNHVTGKIRGLLCHPCNTAIGLLRDDKETLLKAIMYLEKD